MNHEITFPENVFLPPSKSKPFPIPEDEDFEDKSFLPSPDVQAVGARLIFRESRFSFLRGVEILYSWKQEGGKQNNKLVFGRVGKISPKERFLCDGKYEFLMWVAADHARRTCFTEFQMEALVFHELCHFAKQGGAIGIVGHDFEGFTAEIETYGLWTNSLRSLEFLKQGRLF